MPNERPGSQATPSIWRRNNLLYRSIGGLSLLLASSMHGGDHGLGLYYGGALGFPMLALLARPLSSHSLDRSDFLN